MERHSVPTEFWQNIGKSFMPCTVPYLQLPSLYNDFLSLKNLDILASYYRCSNEVKVMEKNKIVSGAKVIGRKIFNAMQFLLCIQSEISRMLNLVTFFCPTASQ